MIFVLSQVKIRRLRTYVAYTISYDGINDKYPNVINVLIEILQITNAKPYQANFLEISCKIKHVNADKSRNEYTR